MTDFETEFARRNALSHVLAMAPCLHDRSFPDNRKTAEKLLIRHLPTLRPEDAEWINREEVKALFMALDPANSLVTIAILGALGQIGDRRAIRHVESLAGRLSRTYDSDSNLLREAADDCLTRLRVHADRTKQSSVLLRGSQQPASSAQSILLRAASKTTSTASSELLRAGEAGAEQALRKEKHDDTSF